MGHRGQMIRRRRTGRAARGLVIAVVVVGLLAVPACSSGGGDDDDATGEAVLTVREPAVEVASGGGDFEGVDDQQALGVGDSIRTDSDGRGQIDYSDGSLTRVGGDTEYEILELAEADGPRVTVASLDVGSTYHRVADLSESGDKFEVQTASASAAVVGTVFAVVRTPDGATVYTVLEGEVTITLSDGTEISLTAGQRVVVNADGTAGPVEDLSPDQILADPWLAENLAIDAEEEDAIDVPGVFDGDAAASVVGTWDVTLTATSADGISDLAVGDSRTRTYEIDVDCSGGICDVFLNLEGADSSSRVPLTWTGSSYVATVSGLGTQDCVLADGTVAAADGISSQATVTIEVVDVELVDGTWQATLLEGTASETATPTGPASDCLAGTATYDLRAEVQ